MNPKIRIIVAEAKEVVRKSIVALLKTKSDFQVDSDVRDGKELLEILKKNQVDIVLLDANIPLMDAKTTMGIILRRFPETKIIILSQESNNQHQADYLLHGASSYLSKDSSVETLFEAIYKVNLFGFFFNDSTSKALLESLLKGKQRSENGGNVNFNERETEIIKKICDGKTNKEIAANMHLSSSTIDFYRTKIYGKAKCNCSTSLLKFALKSGIVELS
ncbi:response regulator transcription factor [Aurantibacillus circumpalustris]|uniref:response regulator transcription factor n=1 Tax=Aurantibacillus circumpalustris TaxID=3036359 RepID=UPI00295AA532|nr:response regulator transcription factor [Aurantibacillus circumpalustris]